MVKLRILFLSALLFLCYSYCFSRCDTLEGYQNIYPKNEFKDSSSLQYEISKVRERLIDNEFDKFLEDNFNDTNKCIEILYNCKIDSIVDKRLIWYSDIDYDNGWMYRTSSTFFVSQRMKAYSWIIRLYFELNLKEDDIMVFKTDNKGTIYDYKSKWIMDSTGYDSEYVKNGGLLIKTRIGDEPLNYYKSNNSNLLDLERKFYLWILKLKERGIEYLKLNKIAPLTEEEFEIQ
ncbi:MAG: hypothetical protein R2863_04955 [Candidatus Kapaibacterium sp.]|nr:hypothetical protein [Ignavibacteria bacterium]